ncbi:MAG: METTL5 family protein [Thermoplasmatota archaeon]
MRKRHLEMALSKLPDLEDPDPGLEQYRTPPRLVCDILWQALENGDINNRTVLELGCGGAPFALGSMMLGAARTSGVDKDPRCLSLAGSNLRSCIEKGWIDGSMPLQLILGDVSDPSIDIQDHDTVFMNPPFGAQKRHADRDFIRTACRKGSVVYGIHNGGTRDFVMNEYDRMGAGELDVFEGRMDIPHRFHFHTEEMRIIDILIVVARVPPRG